VAGLGPRSLKKNVRQVTARARRWSSGRLWRVTPPLPQGAASERLALAGDGGLRYRGFLGSSSARLLTMSLVAVARHAAWNGTHILELSGPVAVRATS
jgi:hypothetical protein